MTLLVVLVSMALLGISNATPRYTLLGAARQGYITVPEDLPVGTILFSIHAQDSDPRNVLMLRTSDTLTTSYVSVGQRSTGNDVTFNITLTQPLDRETIRVLKLYFDLTDIPHNSIHISVDVNINDVNDNIPIFSRASYMWTFPERPCNMSASFNGITAMDADSFVNGRVTYAMRSKDSHMDEYFQIDSVTGAVQQIKCLDFETESYYNFVVTAKDGGPNGGLNSSAEFFLHIIDVPDTPPYFIIAPRRIDVHENEAPGYNITRFYAIDGDVDISQNTPIRYSITYSQCGDGLFTIDSVDGTVTSVTSLDAEANIIKQHFGVCKLTIRASEIPSSNFTVYGPRSVSTDLYVYVSDDDDNSPVFTSNLYNGTVPRYASPNSSVTLQEKIHVSDNDQDFNFANMKLTLLWSNGSDCDAFFVMPTCIHWSGDVQILVKDPAVIKDSINKTFHMKVIATGTMRQSEASVSIKILDTATNNMSLCPTCSPVRCPTVTATPTSSSLDASVTCSTISEPNLRIVRERLHMMRREIDMFIQLLEN